MKKLLIALVITLSSLSLAAQDSIQFTWLRDYGFGWKKGWFKDALRIPLSSSTYSPHGPGWIRMNISDSTLEMFTGTQWMKISVSPVDLTALTALIGTKLNIIDTTGRYLTKICRKPGTDSVFAYFAGVPVFQYMDSSGSGGATDTTRFVNINGSYANPSWLTSLAPSKLTQSGATSGQALLWNGSIWAPATISGVLPSSGIAPGRFLMVNNSYTPEWENNVLVFSYTGGTGGAGYLSLFPNVYGVEWNAADIGPNSIAHVIPDFPDNAGVTVTIKWPQFAGRLLTEEKAATLYSTTSLANGKIFVGNGSNVATAVTPSGDLTMSNVGAFTLASTAVTAASYGSSTAIPSFTVDAKGRITAASTNVVIAPAGTLTGKLTVGSTLDTAVNVAHSVVTNDRMHKIVDSLNALGWITASSTNTLTNKTISGASNTFSNIGNGSLTNSSFTLNGNSISLGGSKTLSLASSDFANQGTNTTVLIGNGAGNPTFGAVNLATMVTGKLTVGSNLDTGVNVAHSVVSNDRMHKIVDSLVAAGWGSSKWADTLSSTGITAGIKNVFVNGMLKVHGILLTTLLASSDAITLDLTKDLYVFSGGTDVNWSLPTLTNGKIFYIKNRGSANLFLHADSGTDIFDATAVVAIMLLPGQSVTLIADGDFWYVF